MKKKYSTDAERKVAHGIAMKRYRRSEKGKSADRRYRQSKKGRIVNKIAMRRCTLKRYDMTTDEYNQRFIEQKGCCAICNKHQSEFKRALAVDHNRETGTVRELLCINCNTMLGQAKHSIDRLRAGIVYLEKWNAE